MHKTYVTFGFDHCHKINNNIIDHNCVAVIESENAQAGRAKAFELFGPVFAFEYPEAYWDDDSMKYYPRGYIKVNGK